MQNVIRIPALVMLACLPSSCHDPAALSRAGAPRFQMESAGLARVSGTAVLPTPFFASGQVAVTVSGVVTPSGPTFGNVLIDQDYFTPTRRLHGLIPPSSGRDWWCIDAADDPVVDGGFTIFVRDVGDGETSLDEVVLTIGISTIHCPQPGDFFAEPLTFSPALGGDFRFEP